MVKTNNNKVIKIPIEKFAVKIREYRNGKITFLFENQHKRKYRRYQRFRKKYRFLDNSWFYHQYDAVFKVECEQKVYQFIFTEVSRLTFSVQENQMVWENQDIIQCDKNKYYIKIYVNEEDYIEFMFKSIVEKGEVQ